MIYLTSPLALYPRIDGIGRDDRFDFYLTNAEVAYGQPPSGIQDMFGAVREGAVELETYGAAALRMVLAASDSAPWITFDCRSAAAIGGPAPTYKLAAKAGLQTTLPVMLSGQGGIESLQAMLFLAGSARAGCGAIVSSSWEVSRNSCAPALTGMFAAACLVSRKPFVGRQIRIHGIGLARGGCDTAAISIAVTEAQRQCSSILPSWIAASPGWAELEPWSHSLPRGSRLLATSDRHLDVIHPDPLLAITRHEAAIPDGEDGMLVCLGRTGAVGAIVLSILNHGAD